MSSWIREKRNVKKRQGSEERRGSGLYKRGEGDRARNKYIVIA